MRQWIISIFLLLMGYLLINNNEELKYDNVFLVYSINEQNPIKDDVVYIKEGDRLKIYPVGVVGGQYYSEVDNIYIDGKRIKTYPIDKKQSLYWYTILPVLKEYDNVVGSTKKNIVTFKVPLTYTYKQTDETFVQQLVEKKDYGTYYLTFQQEAINSDFTFRSIGAIHREQDNILQIVYRPDDTYIGYLYELFHTPFIMAPKSVEGKYHQTDERVGSDCAELAIYGMRRLGYSIPYCGPKSIYSYTEIICDKSSLANGHTHYVNGKKQKISVSREEGIYPGDIIHFGPQVSVFYKDQGTIGYLDCQDILIQSYGVTPSLTTIQDSGFGQYSVIFASVSNVLSEKHCFHNEGIVCTV